jgi:hypothetical protein
MSHEGNPWMSAARLDRRAPVPISDDDAEPNRPRSNAKVNRTRHQVRRLRRAPDGVVPRETSRRVGTRKSHH